MIEVPSVERLTEALHQANHPGYMPKDNRFDLCRSEAVRILAILTKLSQSPSDSASASQ